MNLPACPVCGQLLNEPSPHECPGPNTQPVHEVAQAIVNGLAWTDMTHPYGFVKFLVEGASNREVEGKANEYRTNLLLRWAGLRAARPNCSVTARSRVRLRNRGRLRRDAPLLHLGLRAEVRRDEAAYGGCRPSRLGSVVHGRTGDTWGDEALKHVELGA